MVHKRKQVRDEVKSVLNQNVTLVSETNIMTSRLETIWDRAKIPCVLIYTLEDLAESSANQNPSYIQELFLQVEVVHEVSVDLDDKLDAICLEIEKALSENSDLNNLVEGLERQSTKITMVREGKRSVGSAVLTYKITYLSEV